MCFGIEFIIITACSMLLNIALGVVLNAKMTENQQLPTAENIPAAVIQPAEVIISYNNAAYMQPMHPEEV